MTWPYTWTIQCVASVSFPLEVYLELSMWNFELIATMKVDIVATVSSSTQ
jgi:hypothetical protein